MKAVLRFLLAFLLPLFLFSTAWAMPGLDLLGLGSPKWDMEATLETFPQGWALGTFDTVFGDALPNVKKLLATGKVSAFRVQMEYNTAHNLIGLDQLKKRAILYEKLALQYPNVKFYMSHTCEYRSPDAKAVQQRIDIIKKYAPHYEPVNSIMTGGVTIKGVLNETHDTTRARKDRFLVSMDGNSVTWKMDVEAYQKRFANAEVNFIWAALFNMAEQANTKPPKERTVSPDEKFMKAIIRLAEPAGTPPVPAFKGKIVPIKKPYLMKAFAEDSPGDIRGNKPMLISPSRAASLDIVDMNGKKVASFKYFGNYTPGLWRHYSGTGSNLYGYQIARLAKESSGSEFVWAKDGKTFYGPFHPQFRIGFFDN